MKSIRTAYDNNKNKYLAWLALLRLQSNFTDIIKYFQMPTKRAVNWF